MQYRKFLVIFDRNIKINVPLLWSPLQCTRMWVHVMLVVACCLLDHSVNSTLYLTFKFDVLCTFRFTFIYIKNWNVNILTFRNVSVSLCSISTFANESFLKWLSDVVVFESINLAWKANNVKNVFCFRKGYSLRRDKKMIFFSSRSCLLTVTLFLFTFLKGWHVFGQVFFCLYLQMEHTINKNFSR